MHFFKWVSYFRHNWKEMCFLEFNWELMHRFWKWLAPNIKATGYYQGRLTNVQPISETMATHFIDAYIGHQVWRGQCFTVAAITLPRVCLQKHSVIKWCHLFHFCIYWTSLCCTGFGIFCVIIYLIVLRLRLLRHSIKQLIPELCNVSSQFWWGWWQLEAKMSNYAPSQCGEIRENANAWHDSWPQFRTTTKQNILNAKNNGSSCIGLHYRWILGRTRRRWWSTETRPWPSWWSSWPSWWSSWWISWR